MINFWLDESGQALTEYALIIGLIFVTCLLVITQLGLTIKDVLYPNENELNGLFGNNN